MGCADVQHLSDENFKARVMTSEEPWLVEFYAPWCEALPRLGLLPADARHNTTAIRGHPHVLLYLGPGLLPCALVTPPYVNAVNASASNAQSDMLLALKCRIASIPALHQEHCRGRLTACSTGAGTASS